MPAPGPSARESTATFSTCRSYRYDLWRRWGGPDAKYVMFVGLNPSTADETTDDPTIRRCIAFAKSWGYGALCMTNLFAFRATQPADMRPTLEPVGEDNDRTLIERAANAGIVVAAWGVNGTHLSRDTTVRKLLPTLHHLGLTQAGQPRHPLYLLGTSTPVLFQAGSTKSP